MEIDLPDYDPWSFNRAERRTIQERFGHDFRVLIEYARERMYKPTPPAIAQLKYPNGDVIFADDFVEAVLLEQVRREQPDAPADFLADVGLFELVFKPRKPDEGEAAEDGDEGKAATTSSPSKRSTSKKKT